MADVEEKTFQDGFCTNTCLHCTGIAWIWVVLVRILFFCLGSHSVLGRDMHGVGGPAGVGLGVEWSKLLSGFWLCGLSAFCGLRCGFWACVWMLWVFPLSLEILIFGSLVGAHLCSVGFVHGVCFWCSLLRSVLCCMACCGGPVRCGSGRRVWVLRGRRYWA
ncbi:hypothetical protein ATANTOWER_024761 [Ataeniobius toweri]|uniref:Transmembrane protein n=1 Tax=Ataeniobius toweri TaxID=208326 RepID=A0ABU7B5J8_9TELE|nr:hypothetical protein [Ataeniobius toweri]